MRDRETAAPQQLASSLNRKEKRSCSPTWAVGVLPIVRCALGQAEAGRHLALQGTWLTRRDPRSVWWARRKSLKSSAQCPLGPCHLPTPQHATLAQRFPSHSSSGLSSHQVDTFFVQQTGEKHPTGARLQTGHRNEGDTALPCSHEGGNQEPGRCLTCAGGGKAAARGPEAAELTRHKVPGTERELLVMTSTSPHMWPHTRSHLTAEPPPATLTSFPLSASLQAPDSI